MEKDRYSAVKEDDTILLEDIIERNFYLKNKPIELIVNRKNKESLCYGCFNNDETVLYPEIDFSENDYDKIYKNLKMILNFYKKNNNCTDIKITGIDWTNGPEAESILQILYNSFDKLECSKTIYITTDCRFLLNDNYNDIWQKYIKLFLEKNIILYFNIHANGLYCDDNNFDIDFYKKLKDFLSIIKNHYQICAYIRPSNIMNWIKNFQWYIEFLDIDALTNIKLYEEKTDKWTKNLIAEYILFLEFQINYYKDTLHNEDFLLLAFDKFNQIKFNTISLLDNGYIDNVNNNNNCNLFSCLTIDLTTLNIVPCAKTNYEDFAWGKFDITNDEITGYSAKNVAVSIISAHLKQVCLPHCENCIQVDMCSGHCFGESYNKCLDMLVPIKEFCDLSRAKTNFLIYEYNILDIIHEDLLEKLKCNKNYIYTIVKIKDYLSKGKE